MSEFILWFLKRDCSNKRLWQIGIQACYIVFEPVITVPEIMNNVDEQKLLANTKNPGVAGFNKCCN